MTERLFCVVALPSEARPLVRSWDLSRLSDSDVYPVYQSRCGTRTLIVSGIGKVAAAAAVGYLAGRLRAKGSDAWLNVGIAGSGEYSLGSLVVGHKVVDVGSDRNWYPSQLFQGPRMKYCQSTDIRTFDQVVSKYPPKGVVEMEAAGFIGAAMRYASVELVQVLKVVSDTPADDVVQVTPQRVVEWISGHLATINGVAEELLVLSRELDVLSKEPRELSTILERWRFSVSESHKLRKLIRRWDLVYPTEPVWGTIEQCVSSKTVLGGLEKALKQAPVYLTKEV